jgi:hypothetical protein
VTTDDLGEGVFHPVLRIPLEQFEVRVAHFGNLSSPAPRIRQAFFGQGGSHAARANPATTAVRCFQKLPAGVLQLCELYDDWCLPNDPSPWPSPHPMGRGEAGGRVRWVWFVSGLRRRCLHRAGPMPQRSPRPPASPQRRQIVSLAPSDGERVRVRGRRESKQSEYADQHFATPVPSPIPTTKNNCYPLRALPSTNPPPHGFEACTPIATSAVCRRWSSSVGQGGGCP